MDLATLFQQLNEKHFDGFLTPPELHWNSRLRSSAGRFIPGTRKLHWLGHRRDPKIEVASYLKGLEKAEHHVTDTLAHEMIHYWLWVRRRPHGHTPEFWSKMQLMGVSRYNPVPQTRPFKFTYQCPHCQNEFKTRKRLGKLACAKCCKEHASGRYDIRFVLSLVAEKTSSPKE